MKYVKFAIILLIASVLLLSVSACESKNNCPEVTSTGLEDEPPLGFNQQMTMTAVSENPQIDTCNIEFEGHIRRYMMFVPKDYSSDNSYPLVVYLHGYGWSATDGMYYTLLHQAAETNGYLVVYPSAKPNWNSGLGNDPVWPTPNINDVGFINALIDSLSNRYNIDSDRIYATGFSNGGFMAYRLACQISDRIAAVASVAGVLSTEVAANCNPSHSMPVLHIHGTDDTVIHIDGGVEKYSVDQTLNYWVEFNNCAKVDTATLPDLDPNDGSTVEKYSYTDCDNNSNVIYYKVINGGHSWPGATTPMRKVWWCMTYTILND